MNCPTRDHSEGNPSWNQNPSPLAPELTTRSSPVCGGQKVGTYNLPLHILALFIVLVLSTLACSFPIMVKKIPQLKVPHQFLFLSRHFGTGVLIATAFVHLLPTAFTSLTDPCLPEFWNKGYPAMAGLIAMTAVFLVVTIEMIFSTMNGESLGGCHGGHGSSTVYQPISIQAEDEGESVGVLGNGQLNAVTRPNGGLESIGRRRSGGRHRRSGSIGGSLRKMGIDRSFISLESIPSSRTDHDCGVEQDPENCTQNSFTSDSDEETELIGNGSADRSEISLITTPLNRRRRSASNPIDKTPHNSGTATLAEGQQQQKMLLQVLLLEAGILFHSVFIGMALSVAMGSNFIVLLIAISFHQTFEGLALGSRIAGITTFPPGSLKPWLMSLAYGTTTPFGQAIGLFTRNLYDPKTQTGLLMVGIMNAISSGLLLFAGLVELLAEDFLSDESYVVLKGKRRVQAGLAVVAGAAGMALVGAWA